MKNLLSIIDSNERGTGKVVFGKRMGVIALLFGCRHKDLSRPFSEGDLSYRSCTSCGARKPFDADTLVTHRTFYYPPPASAN